MSSAGAYLDPPRATSCQQPATIVDPAQELSHHKIMRDAQVERQQAEAERAKQEARELRQYRKSLVFRVRTASRPVACSVNLRRWGRNKLACCPCPIELACGRSASLRSPLQHRP